jgi:Flp pilus assembly protein TadG
MSGRIPSRFQNDERGQAAIEFALVIGLLVILMVSMLEMTIFLYNYAVLTDAAKEGIRYAMVHGSSGTNPSGTGGPCGTTTSGGTFTAVQAYAAASLHNVSNMNVNVCYSDGNNNPGSRVQVSVSYPYSPLFLVNWASVSISAISVGRIQF